MIIIKFWHINVSVRIYVHGAILLGFIFDRYHLDAKKPLPRLIENFQEMLYFEVYKIVVVTQFNCCSCHFFHWMCWEKTQRCCSSCSWCLSPCQRLNTIIHRSIKMTLKTYPFLTCLESLERLMYKTKVVFNHWNDQKKINNSPMTPLNHPQIHQDDLEDMTLLDMLGVTLESDEQNKICS